MAKDKNLGFRIPKINIIKEFTRKRVTKPTKIIKKDKYLRQREKERLRKELKEEGYE